MKKKLFLSIFELVLLMSFSAFGTFAQSDDTKFTEEKNLSELRPPIEGRVSDSLMPSAAFDSFDNIPIFSSGAAGIYPSTINVSGLTGTITDVNISLYNINHTSFNNLDIMLVSPGGKNLVFLSDVDYSPANVTNLSIAFDDSAPNRIPLFSAPVNGIFKPSVYTDPGEGADFYAAPAPPFSGETELNVLNGSDPNGIWRLYVMDDTPGASGAISAGWRLEIKTAPANRAAKVLDFDGDGRTDYAVVRNVGGRLQWYIQRTTLGFMSLEWGINGDSIVPADYNGDGRTDIAVWGARSGSIAASYFVADTSGGNMIIPWGMVGDDARLVQDFDGDGIADPAIVRTQGTDLFWYIRQSASGGAIRVENFGKSTLGDIAIRGDYDGDGKADPAVYRTSGTSLDTFIVQKSSSRSVKVADFGNFSTDYIIPSDFDGDGVTDFAVWRGLTVGAGSGSWFWINSRSNLVSGVPFGLGGTPFSPDYPVPGDYDGDGRSDQAVWRRDTRIFYTNGGSPTSLMFGLSTDRLVSYELQVR
ncbi:MAG: VCBS repeat-containing protein [Pyrinomonadaceae bacterium]|nr:VCBS repeat-containing protein [Pyrinomonadaceae bacterium]